MGAENGFVVIEETKEQLQKLFNEAFMQKYTNFNNFEEFAFSGAVFVNWNAVPVIGTRAAFDHCVIGTSQFNSWEEMYRKALSEQGIENPDSLLSEECRRCLGKMSQKE